MSDIFSFSGFLSQLCCAAKPTTDAGVALFLRVSDLDDVLASGRHDLCVISVYEEEEPLPVGPTPSTAQDTFLQEGEDAPAEVAGQVAAEFEEKELRASPCPDDADDADGAEAIRSQLASSGMAVNCRCGRHEGVPNQDSLFLFRLGELTVLGLADGFGHFGHWAADWVAKFALASLLSERLAEMPKESYLKELYGTVHRALKFRCARDGKDLSVSGSMLSLVLIDHGARNVLSAWVGDSKCVLGELLPGSNGRATVVDDVHRNRTRSSVREVEPLTLEDDPRGSAGAVVRNPAMERRLGNLAAHGLGSSHTPATKCIACSGTDAFVVCCTDAVWEQFDDTQEVLDLVGKAGREGVRDASEALVQLAQTRCLEALAASDETYEDMSVAVIWI